MAEILEASRLSRGGFYHHVRSAFRLDKCYLVAAGQNSGKLVLYKIRDDGSLERFATTEIGSKPWWVLIVHR